MNPHDIRPRLLVGLTGGIGSGKTTVANLFAGHGVPLIDTDLIAHALTGPDGAAMPAIRETFGAAVIQADGRLDRDAMRALAFADIGNRRRLEAILHPMIRAETQRGIAEAAAAPYAIVVIPLLVESGNPTHWLDRVLVVDCPVEIQVERVMRRNGLAREQVEAIVAAQADRARRLAAADDILENAGATPADLAERVEVLHADYLRRALGAAGS
ncbi:MAG: hypothetical protein RIS35_313 [Pseudomonadota bacterium]|jgi:dephospho-CoA kinase